MIPNVSPTTISNNEAIFIWLDILGFSDALEDDQAYHKLHTLLDTFKNTFFSKKYSYASQVIADGIILKIASKDEKEISGILKEIGEKQFQFILTERYFIRGGIAVGSHFDAKEEEKLFLMGNGLSRAVKMEAKSVHHAVIGTNLKTIQKIRDICDPKSLDEPLFGLKKTVNENGDDLFFIDFIQQNIDFENMLHKELSENRANPVIQKKYLWIYRYYINKFGKTYRSFDDVLGVLL